MPQLLKLRKKSTTAPASSSTRSATTPARTTSSCGGWPGGAPISLLANVFVLSRRRHASSTPAGSPASSDSPSCSPRWSASAGSPDKRARLGLDLAARQMAIARGHGLPRRVSRRPPRGGGLRRPSSRRRTPTRPTAALAREDPVRPRGRVILVRARSRDGAVGARARARVREVAAQAPPRPRRARCATGSAGACTTSPSSDDAPLAGPGRALYGASSKAPGSSAGRCTWSSRRRRSPMFGCRDCGDCSLPDIAYLCPESQCAKNQRNGPCGGTRDGKPCEVGEKDCIWALAYDRLKEYGEEATMLEGPPVIKDNALRGTSAGPTRSSAAITTPSASAEARRQGRARHRVRHGRAGMGQREDDLGAVRPPGGDDRRASTATSTRPPRPSGSSARRAAPARSTRATSRTPSRSPPHVGACRGALRPHRRAGQQRRALRPRRPRWSWIRRRGRTRWRSTCAAPTCCATRCCRSWSVRAAGRS